MSGWFKNKEMCNERGCGVVHKHYGRPSPDGHVAGYKFYHSIIFKPFTVEVESVNSSATWCLQPKLQI
jgi:hypothetical protein